MTEKAFTLDPATPADHDLYLLRAVADGDAGALDALYQRHGLHLLNYLIGQVGERALAEEVLQDVMVTVWRGAGRFRGDSRVRTWLFTIARRKASRARKRRPPMHDPLEDAAAGTGDPVSRLDEVHALEAAMAQLPTHQQEALDLVFYRGLTGPEAADHLNIPLNTFKSRLKRAREALRTLLAEGDTAP
jgi:RNA polymerase sigma-70 factor (ECF subfamily)